MRKEYNDRWNAPLVNVAITLEEHDANMLVKSIFGVSDAVLTRQVKEAAAAEQKAFFAKVKEASRDNA